MFPLVPSLFPRPSSSISQCLRRCSHCSRCSRTNCRRMGKLPALGILEHHPAEWREEFSRWASDRRAYRDSCHDSAGIGFLMVDFAEWWLRGMQSVANDQHLNWSCGMPVLRSGMVCRKSGAQGVCPVLPGPASARTGCCGWSPSWAWRRAWREAAGIIAVGTRADLQAGGFSAAGVVIRNEGKKVVRWTDLAFVSRRRPGTRWKHQIASW